MKARHVQVNKELTAEYGLIDGFKLKVNRMLQLTRFIVLGIWLYVRK